MAEAWGQAAELDRPGSARSGFNSENPVAATKVDVCLLKLTMSSTHTFLWTCTHMNTHVRTHTCMSEHTRNKRNQRFLDSLCSLFRKPDMVKCPHNPKWLKIQYNSYQNPRTVISKRAWTWVGEKWKGKKERGKERGTWFRQEQGPPWDQACPQHLPALGHWNSGFALVEEKELNKAVESEDPLQRKGADRESLYVSIPTLRR